MIDLKVGRHERRGRHEVRHLWRMQGWVIIVPSEKPSKVTRALRWFEGVRPGPRVG